MSSNKTSYGAKAFGVGLLSVVLCILIICLVAPYHIDWGAIQAERQNKNGSSSSTDTPNEKDETFKVVSVVDGDTIRIDYYGKEELVRLIGVNTPEVDGPYTEKECYGDEASAFAKEKLTGQWVTLEADSSQSNRDKYDRLLRYVSLDGEDFGELSISRGYAYEYTYNNPYSKQAEYKTAQEEARNAVKGLWRSCSDSANTDTAANEESASQKASHTYGEDGDCNIKGNISYNTGEKIYHVPGQEYYDETVISPEYGERWFCSEEEARAAGWRRANEPITDTIEYRSPEGNGVVIEKDEGSSDSEDFVHEGAGYREVEDKAYLIETENNDQSEAAPEEVNADNMKNSRRRLIVSILCFLFAIALTIMWIAMVTSAFHGKHKAGVLLSVLLLPAIIATLIAISRLLIEIIK